jgi:hypothetical protein
MMRAGRYIREQIEKRIGISPGWEEWLESQSELRLMDKHFFACFIVIYFAYYFLSVAMAMGRLWNEALNEPSGLYWYRVYGAVSIYAIATVWAIATLVHHWKSSVSTIANTKTTGD